MSLADQRAAGEHQEDLTDEPENVVFEDEPAVGGLRAIPKGAQPRGVIVYLYGGGYVISSPASRRKMAGHLASASGARVLVPRYRLGPEDPFPGAVEDAAAAIAWLNEDGTPSGEIIVAGDSSAGGLAIATLLKLRHDGLPAPAGAVAISPWVDLACTAASLDQNDDLSVTREGLERMAGQYLGDADPRNPLASPLYGDLTGLPPLKIVVGGAEALLDDSIRLTRAAGVAGVDVSLRIGAQMQHVFPLYSGFMPEADEAVAEIGQWVQARLL
jgi:acetyl esterase/lipase